MIASKIKKFSYSIQPVSNMAPYGQIVIGPPGAGKSTYCNGMNQFLNSIGRNSLIVNLDPANDRLPYDCTLDVRDFITLEEVMDDEGLGPNGGLIFCMGMFEHNMDIFMAKVKELIKLSMDGESTYMIFDCPGQTELFTASDTFAQIFKNLVDDLDFRLCVVSLVDSINLTIPSHWISSLLLSLRSMLQMNLPQVNVISKIDLLSNYIKNAQMSKVHGGNGEEDHPEHGGLPFNLQYYTEVQDLQYLIPFIATENNQRSHQWFNEKYNRLTECISEVIEDFGLLSYQVLAIEDKTSMINLLSLIDKSNGYCFGTNELGGDSIWSDAIRQSSMGFMEDIDIQERWLDEKEAWDQLEDEKRKELQSHFQQNEKPFDVESEWEESLKQWESQNNKSIHK